MSSATGQALHERTRALLTLIDGLQIETDLHSARRTLDDWQKEMLALVNQIHVISTHRLDSLTARLQQLKERRSASLKQDVLPTLNKMVIERRKNLTDHELNEIKKKIGQVDDELQSFGRLLLKNTQDEKRLNEQVVLLKNIQRENTHLNLIDRLNNPQRRFILDTDYSPFLAVSEDNHVLIEDDNHLVLYDSERRLNEIPWQQGKDQTFVGSIKDLTYSNHLDQFCVLSSMNFFTLDPRLFTLEKIEPIRPGTGSHFQSVACVPYSSDVYFALTTSGGRITIERWSLLSGSLIRRWYHDIFESDDRLISSIRANETCLAIAIKEQKNVNSASSSSRTDPGQWRVDLFDFSLVRMYRGVNLKSGGLGTFLSPFDDRSWLVINGNDLWLIGEQGDCIEEKKFLEKEKLHNIIIKNEDSQGRRQLIVKMGQPAELRLV